MSNFWLGFVSSLVIAGIIVGGAAWIVGWIMLAIDEYVPNWVAIVVLVVTLILGIGIMGGVTYSST